MSETCWFVTYQYKYLRGKGTQIDLYRDEHTANLNDIINEIQKDIFYIPEIMEKINNVSN